MSHYGAPCQAQRKDGLACWRPATRDPVIPGVHLCWIHAAQVLVATQGMPNWQKVKAAERRGALRLVGEATG